MAKLRYSGIFKIIRDQVKLIPRGYVSTYGNVAASVSLKNARIVGWALRGNQDSTIPCHRVVQKSGTLAVNFSLGGAGEQRRRLLADSTVFISDYQVDLKKCFFDLTKTQLSHS
jgi:methylated-DNA-protein-cysteine methyltransferase related protein